MKQPARKGAVRPERGLQPAPASLRIVNVPPLLPLLAAAAMALPATRAAAQKWEWTPSIGVQGTVTNNVDLVPTSQRQSDFVIQLTPAIAVKELGDHTRLEGSVSVPILFYARTGGENNNVYPTVDLLGDVNFFDKVFHIEGAVNLTQQFFTPFGAQPSDLSNATNNRYTAQTYRISPYVASRFGNNIEYELRNNNTWVNLSSAPTATDNSFTTEFLARAGTPQDQLVGWSASYDYANTKFTNQDSAIVTQLARVAPYYSVTPQFRVDASVGYESNEYQLSSSRGAIYGVGFRWRPSERTDVVGKWEHRFFGSSYLFTFDHRTPLTVWNVRFSRNISTYPQQIAALSAGTNVAGYLNGLFLSAFPDPAQRQQFVEQFMQDRGLAPVLTSPVSLYTEQILLLQEQSATVGLIGARNTIFFNVFNVLSEPIAASGTPLPPSLFSQNANTQTGGSVIWTNRLTASVNMTSTFTLLRTDANAPLVGRTNQGYASINLSMPITGRTSAFVGVRYQTLASNIQFGYNETAAFAGFVYTLR